MKIILLGPPGAGKGTQAKYICKKFNIKQISTGDILRAAIKAETDIGKQAKKIINSGNLVSDNMIISLVKNRIKEKDCANGYLLDGFPRTIAQADALKKEKISINFIVEIQVPDTQIISRLSGRRIHIASGRTYHIEFNSPKITGKDDQTGEAIIQRDDDKEDVVRERLNVYHQQTKPLAKYYINYTKQNKQENLKFFAVDGLGTLDEIKNRISKVLS